MRVRAIGTNMTEVYVGSNRFLVSYHTPVAAYIEGEGYYRTARRWSATTSKHINKWLSGVSASEVPQNVLDNWMEVA